MRVYGCCGAVGDCSRWTVLQRRTPSLVLARTVAAVLVVAEDEALITRWR